MNTAIHFSEDLTSRCYLHWRYICQQCSKEQHFNGITWCITCKLFTCINCSTNTIVKTDFLIYDYYYSIDCYNCQKPSPALDFAEYKGTHPFQIGDQHPSEPISVWIPISPDNIKKSKFKVYAGRNRILKLVNTKFIRSLDHPDPKEVWDKLAEKWVANVGEEGDFNHKSIIVPEVLRLLDIQGDERILDVACGEGLVARKIRRFGCSVIGIDFSEMLSYAIKKEVEDNLGIQYFNYSAYDLMNYFEPDSFDKIVCNMAIMDMDNLDAFLHNVEFLLKPDGVFVFSLTHPCLGWPAVNTIKLPNDSHRNEDKVWVVDNYFNNIPTQVPVEDLPTNLLYFPRTLTEYINTLAKYNLFIQQLSEPQVDEELIKKYPRHTLNDYDRIPSFMIVKTKILKI